MGIAGNSVVEIVHLLANSRKIVISFIEVETNLKIGLVELFASTNCKSSRSVIYDIKSIHDSLASFSKANKKMSKMIQEIIMVYRTKHVI